MTNAPFPHWNSAGFLPFGSSSLVRRILGPPYYACLAAPPRQARDTLQIYFVDVEGGQATLFVAPGGQSLSSTGLGGQDGRDADRYVAAARKAAIERIDFVLLTHFHQDHAAGSLSSPPRSQLDGHRSWREPRACGAATEQAWQDYQKILGETMSNSCSSNREMSARLWALRPKSSALDGR